MNHPMNSEGSQENQEFKGMELPIIDLEGLNWHQQSQAHTYATPSNQLENIMKYVTSEVAPYNPICWTKTGVIITTPIGGGPRSHQFFVDSASNSGGERPLILLMPNDPSFHRILITKHMSPIISISHYTVSDVQFLLTLSEDGHLLLWESDNYSSNKYNIAYEDKSSHIIKVSFIDNQECYYVHPANGKILKSQNSNWQAPNIVLFTTLAATGKIYVVAYDIFQHKMIKEVAVLVNYTKFRSASIGFYQNNILYAITECYPTNCIQIIKVAMSITFNSNNTISINIDQNSQRKILRKTLYCDQHVFSPDFSITHFEFIPTHQFLIVCSSSFREKKGFIQYYRLEDEHLSYDTQQGPKSLHRLKVESVKHDIELRDNQLVTSLDVSPVRIAIGYLNGIMDIFSIKNLKIPMMRTIIKPKTKETSDSYYNEELWGKQVQKRKLNNGKAVPLTDKDDLATVYMLIVSPIVGVAFSPNRVMVAALSHEHSIQLVSRFDVQNAQQNKQNLLKKIPVYSILNKTNITDLLMMIRYLKSHNAIDLNAFKKDNMGMNILKDYPQSTLHVLRACSLIYHVLGETHLAAMFQLKIILQHIKHSDVPQFKNWFFDILRFLLKQVMDYIIYFNSISRHRKINYEDIYRMPNFHLLDFFDQQDNRKILEAIHPTRSDQRSEESNIMGCVFKLFDYTNVINENQNKIKYWVFNKKKEAIGFAKILERNFVNLKLDVSLYTLQVLPLLKEYLHPIPPPVTGQQNIPPGSTMDRIFEQLDPSFKAWLPANRHRQTLISMKTYEKFSSFKPHYECMVCGRTSLYTPRGDRSLARCFFCGGYFKLNAGEKMAMMPY